MFVCYVNPASIRIESSVTTEDDKKGHDECHDEHHHDHDHHHHDHHHHNEHGKFGTRKRQDSLLIDVYASALLMCAIASGLYRHNLIMSELQSIIILMIMIIPMIPVFLQSV